MRIVNEGTALMGFPGTTATPGTVTGTGLDWSPYYEPAAKAVFNLGVSNGTVVGYVQGGTALAAGYTSLGSFTAAGAAAGTSVYEIDLDPRSLTYRYLRTFATVADGTAVVSASIVGKQRTVTD